MIIAAPRVDLKLSFLVPQLTPDIQTQRPCPFPFSAGKANLGPQNFGTTPFQHYFEHTHSLLTLPRVIDLP